MSERLFYRPGYGSLINSDGHGEVWMDIDPSSKFKQYGWRCTTNEDSYSNKTLLGNWNQDRYDLCKLKERKPMPSQFAHYYQTSHSVEYPKKDTSINRQVFKKEPHIFPGHQPELDSTQGKNLITTCYMIDFRGATPLPTMH
ncbi:cilia- and flagella-associated protein 68 [Pelobates fuscus]|uniref:cilia- and flagella-associated protein 68 n=1 Tax=Pelobates fuscus TaxID=191477 RepID=UPI002FE45D6B